MHLSRRDFLKICGIGMGWLVGCAPKTSVPPIAPTATDSQSLILPSPRLSGAMSLEETLARRRSVREFADKPLSTEDLGQLLWAAQGITSSVGQRTAPSAGGLYPLELYAVTRANVYHYEPQNHRLSVHLQGDLQSALWSAALQQDAVKNAAVVIVIACVYARASIKYGEERTPRYVHLEAGHAAQNILLQAVALNLGAVTIGAFEDDKVKQGLVLPTDQAPLYLIPIGYLNP